MRGQEGLRLGLDVGGTNTDAVLVAGDDVICSHKARNTSDVITGIENAIRGVLISGNVDPSEITALMLGTTQFVNAVVEGRRLAPTAVVRIGLPATGEIPPMEDWPLLLKKVIGEAVFVCRGGFEVDGRPIVPLDEQCLFQIGREIATRRLRSVAITSVFSPIDPTQEERAAEIIRDSSPSIAVSLSSQIGRIGLLERENATILNAALHDVASEMTDALLSIANLIGITAPVFISQNDGTLMSLEHCRSYPVLTFSSGPTNSMRGAAFLSGESTCIVVDIGGTTTDVGALVGGFPREAGVAIRVAGVRTNFRMPDLVSVGLGGGSIVHLEDSGSVVIGPDSVGHEIASRSLIFGGETVTATDLAVAAGLCDVGQRGLTSRLSPEIVRLGVQQIASSVAQLVDGAKVKKGELPVVLVGGGGILVGNVIDGASRVIRPKNYAVANAVGAAIAQVGGEVDKVVDLTHVAREEALSNAYAVAIDKAVEAGSDRLKTEIVQVEEIPLSYLPSSAMRLRVKAVGPLSFEGPRDATNR